MALHIDGLAVEQGAKDMANVEKGVFNAKGKSDMVFTLHGFFSAEETCREIDSACRQAEIGCVDCKKKLGDAMVEHFAPIRQRWAELRTNPQRVHDALDTGRDRCRAIAEDTMQQVRKKMGLRR